MTDAEATQGSIGLLARVILATFRAIPSVLYWSVTFVTITFPTWLFTLFSISFTFTLSLTSMWASVLSVVHHMGLTIFGSIFIILTVGSAVSWAVRYRLGTTTRTLPKLQRRKEPQIELFPDTQEESYPKAGLHNYIDDILSAIKVFGYLEKTVFHELTRTMQTRKLIAGETLLLEEREAGFCMVVDGMVQIFVKSHRHDESDDSSQEDEQEGRQHNQGYQLLTEVKNGAPMSSLFTILRLFTDDIKLRHDNDDRSRQNSAGLDGHEMRTPDSGTHNPYFPATPRTQPGRTASNRSSTIINSPTGGSLYSVPPLSLESDSSPGINHTETGVPRLKQPKKHKSAHPDIVARATVDTTIAIIPSHAFRRLTTLYPRATSHIVQVILTRLQRVTLATGHAYLGLTSEVLRTERLMNKYTTYDLPGFLRGDALDRLKEKFVKERERIGIDEGMKGIALHNPHAGKRRKSETYYLREIAAARALSRRSTLEKSTDSLIGVSSPEADRAGVSAGDLLTNARPGRFSFSQPLQSPAVSRRDTKSPLERSYFSPFTHPSRGASVHLQRQESADEDNMFRESIVECMFKAIGLTNITDTTMQSVASVEASPRLMSYDSRRQKAIFSNLFFDLPESETESTSSMPLSALGVGGTHNIIDELVHDVEIVFFPKDSVLVEQGERNPGLYYVIEGFLDVSVHEENANDLDILGTTPGPESSSTHDLFAEAYGVPRRGRPSTNRNDSERFLGTKGKKKHRRNLFLTKPGGVAGYLGAVASYRSFVDVTAKTDVYVGFLPRASIERIVERYPVVLLTMAKRLTTLLPRVIIDIDFALEWVQVNAGQVIYNQGEESDAIYIVLNGRLRALEEDKGRATRVIGEYGGGDSVGELDVLTESTRRGSLHAIRSTELVRVPKLLFNSLAQEHPGITMKLSRVIAQRMRSLTDQSLYTPLNGALAAPSAGTNASSTTNLRTVAIIPVTAGIPVTDFATRLLSALNQIGTAAISMNQAAILNHLGKHAFSRMGKLKLSQYLTDLEEKYGMVLYVADTNVQAPWTHTCITQADCILLVAVADASPNIGEYERVLLTTKTTARKELVLLHSERYCPPGLTRSWLLNRSWINGTHHHIQMPLRTAPDPGQTQSNRRFGVTIKQAVQELQAEVRKFTSRRPRQTPLYSAETPFKSDFHRLARRLCGKSIGLVLGGGGARGIAQVGVIRALEEAGIPIDMVGGTSIGGFLGALYAWDADVVSMYGRSKKFAGRMGSLWRLLLDLTYPS